MTQDSCTVVPDLTRAVDACLVRAVGEHHVVDARGALGTAARREVVLDELARHVDEVQPDVLGGIANSGSTWAVLLSDRLGIDFVNVLVDGPRAKGLGRQVEPDDLVTGRSVLLIDNWIETGASITTASEIVHGAGGVVIGALCVSASSAHAVRLPVHVALPFDELVAATTASPINHNHQETQ